ncbi:MAG: SUF system Fe-S cluster assembly protein [Candidatus Dadabacteria bacterium]|nr:MAG: SUF system Fe-S cluster assembly protein [Candidatus Dadabacteria bacterium]
MSETGGNDRDRQGERQEPQGQPQGAAGGAGPQGEPQPARGAGARGPVEATAPEKLSREKLEELVIDALRTVYDPEIPVNIYDLGLIYDLQVEESGFVRIKMTLTTPMCPIAEAMPGMVEHAVRLVHGVTGCDIQLVWDPPWTPDMMTEAARLQLNI